MNKRSLMTLFLALLIATSLYSATTVTVVRGAGAAPTVAYEVLGVDRYVYVDNVQVTFGTNYNADYMYFDLPAGLEWYDYNDMDWQLGARSAGWTAGGAWGVTTDPDQDSNVEWTLVPGQCSVTRLAFRATDDNDSIYYNSGNTFYLMYATTSPTNSECYIKLESDTIHRC